MKIKILKKDGVVAMDTRNSKKFKHYEEGTTVNAINSANDLLSPNVFHFYDFDSYVFELNRTEYEIVT